MDITSTNLSTIRSFTKIMVAIIFLKNISNLKHQIYCSSEATNPATDNSETKGADEINELKELQAENDFKLEDIIGMIDGKATDWTEEKKEEITNIKDSQEPMTYAELKEKIKPGDSQDFKDIKDSYESFEKEIGGKNPIEDDLGTGYICLDDKSTEYQINIKVFQKIEDTAQIKFIPYMHALKEGRHFVFVVMSTSGEAGKVCGYVIAEEVELPESVKAENGEKK